MVEVGKHLTCGFKVELWHRLPHAAAAAAARVQEKQRHSEDLALKHNRRLGGAMSDPRSHSIPLAARAPRNNSEHTLLGASQFLSSIFFTHTPLQVTRTGTRIIGRIATPQPRAWRVLEVREGRVGIGRAPWAGRSLARQRQRAQETRSTEMELGRRDVGLFSFCTSRRNMHNSQHPLADRRFRGAHERAETAPKTNAA